MASTIKDIARKLNISVSTVSYALNNGPRTVPEEVKERVFAVARDMDYRPNALARSMATRRTDTIAIVPPRRSEDLFCSPYLLSVLNSLCDAARKRKQDVLLHTASDECDPELLAQMVLSGKTDAVILIAPFHESKLPQVVARRGFPCILYSAVGPEGTLSVGIDNAAATRQALDHLTALGHRRIGHVAGQLHQADGTERLNAYHAYLSEQGLPQRPDWIACGKFTHEGGYAAARLLLSLSDRPTAILAGNDASGLGVIEAAREMGLLLPEDLSVIGFDLLPLEMTGRYRLTSVRQPIQEMAEKTIDLLAQWTLEGVSPSQRRTIFPTELVVQGSTAPPHPGADIR